MADGQISADEQRELASVAIRLGVPAATTAIDQPAAARQGIGILAASLSDADARRTAYEVALAVCTVDGAPNPPSRPSSARCTERSALPPSGHYIYNIIQFRESARALSAAPLGSPWPAAGAVTDDASLDQRILRQADAHGPPWSCSPTASHNLAILPLQLLPGATRLASVRPAAWTPPRSRTSPALRSRRRGQLVEGLVRKGARRRCLESPRRAPRRRHRASAAGAAVTFAATYALGHAAKQLLRAGDGSLSTDDLRALFARFQTRPRGCFLRSRTDPVAGEAGRLRTSLSQIRSGAF
jgi:hypothetical protein